MIPFFVMDSLRFPLGVYSMKRVSTTCAEETSINIYTLCLECYWRSCMGHWPHDWAILGPSWFTQVCVFEWHIQGWSKQI